MLVLGQPVLASLRGQVDLGARQELVLNYVVPSMWVVACLVGQIFSSQEIG